MKAHIFWRTVISGFIATFVMTIISFLQSGVGLPAIDIGFILTETFNHVHQNDQYTIFWGSAAYYIGGILLALIWVAFLQERMPGNWLIHGVIYGLLITLLAGLVISPLVSMATDDPFGIFYFYTWFPGLIILSGLVMHLSYGLALMLCLKVAGVHGSNAGS